VDGDLSANVIEQTYDTAGRITAKAATTIISGFDTNVQRIEMGYLSRGLTDTVTQYDDDVSGSVLNQVKYTYDEWGNVTAIEQDRDGTVGGGGNQRTVQFGYSLNGTGDGSKRQRVQRDTTTLPNGTVTTNEFTASTIADEIGRAAKVKISSTVLASYQYLGAGQLVGTALGTSGSETVNRLHGGSSASYSTYMDRFGRVVKDEWFKDLGTDVPVHSVGLTYDRNSNITSVDDTLVAGYDVNYAMDNLNRLIDADEGTLSIGTIGSRTRREKWDGGGLSPTGNWLRHKLDLDGNGSYGGTDELDDTGTFNKANEWLTRDLDSTSGTGGNNYSLTHDAAGNMTDDGKDYEYEYDVWGRLRKVRNQATTLVAEYFYDGLGQRTAWHADWDADGTVESSNDDPWYMLVYDDRWRVVATYRVTSSASATAGTIDTYDKPKEQWIYHNAGMDGSGSASYIDLAIVRDRDANHAWTAAGDTTMEERLWYGQNWRADVAVVMNSYGRPLERLKYSAYGVAMQSTALDFNNDGVIDPDDPADFIGTPYDWDLDGDIDLADSTGFTTDYSSYATATIVRGELSLSTIGNRKGYAGYEFEPVASQYHVRHRAYIPELGRWMRRDPIGYVDGMDLYKYCANRALVNNDALGLACGPWIPTGSPYWAECLGSHKPLPSPTPGLTSCICCWDACRVWTRYCPTFFGGSWQSQAICSVIPVVTCTATLPQGIPGLPSINCSDWCNTATPSICPGSTTPPPPTGPGGPPNPNTNTPHWKRPIGIPPQGPVPTPLRPPPVGPVVKIQTCDSIKCKSQAFSNE